MDNPYQSPAAPLDGPEVNLGPPVRPTAVTVFGILNLVFGILGLACTPVSLAALFIPQPPGVAQANPVLKIMAENPNYRTGMYVFAGIGMVNAALLTAAGIGLLKLRPSGRSLSTVYAFLTILTTIASLIFNYMVLIAPLMEAARQANNPAAAGGAYGGAFGGMAGGCGGLIYPILLLVFMNRPNVILAFRQAETARGNRVG